MSAEMWPSLPNLASEVRNQTRLAESVTSQALDRLESCREYHVELASSSAALERARELDTVIAAGSDPGPLAGVPFLAKDNFLTRDTATTAASRMLETFLSPYQATSVERLEAAGAVCVGKTNLDEFAHGSSTENSAFGPTYNPCDRERTPGGSSGGSAAAIALGAVPLALGTDTGGSIRLPASFCGIVGLKPTYGLVSRYGVIAMASSTDVIGPMAASVSDAAYALDVMAGQDGMDATMVERESTYQVERDSLRGLRVGIIREQMESDMDSDVYDATQAAIRSLEDAGVHIQEVSISHEAAALAAYYVLVPAEISSNLSRYDGMKYGKRAKDADNLYEAYLKSRGDGFGSEPIRRILTGTYVLSSGYQDAYYKRAQSIRTLLHREYTEVFSDMDVLLGPTAPTTAFRLGEKRDPWSMYLTDMFTIEANLTGAPAISLPVSNKKSELPVGLQLIGKQRSDRHLLNIASAVEQVV